MLSGTLTNGVGAHGRDSKASLAPSAEAVRRKIREDAKKARAELATTKDKVDCGSSQPQSPAAADAGQFILSMLKKDPNVTQGDPVAGLQDTNGHDRPYQAFVTTPVLAPPVDALSSSKQDGWSSSLTSLWTLDERKQNAVNHSCPPNWHASAEISCADQRWNNVVPQQPQPQAVEQSTAQVGAASIYPRARTASDELVGDTDSLLRMCATAHLDRQVDNVVAASAQQAPASLGHTALSPQTAAMHQQHLQNVQYQQQIAMQQYQQQQYQAHQQQLQLQIHQHRMQMQQAQAAQHAAHQAAHLSHAQPAAPAPLQQPATPAASTIAPAPAASSMQQPQQQMPPPQTPQLQQPLAQQPQMQHFEQLPEPPPAPSTPPNLPPGGYARSSPTTGNGDPATNERGSPPPQGISVLDAAVATAASVPSSPIQGLDVNSLEDGDARLGVADRWSGRSGRAQSSQLAQETLERVFKPWCKQRATQLFRFAHRRFSSGEGRGGIIFQFERTSDVTNGLWPLEEEQWKYMPQGIVNHLGIKTNHVLSAVQRYSPQQQCVVIVLVKEAKFDRFYFLNAPKSHAAHGVVPVSMGSESSPEWYAPQYEQRWGIGNGHAGRVWGGEWDSGWGMTAQVPPFPQAQDWGL